MRSAGAGDVPPHNQPLFRDIARLPRRSAASGRSAAARSNAFASGRGLFENGAVLLASARDLLADYRPVDVREQAFHARLRLLLDSPAPFSRRQFAPGHLTASAFVLSPEADALLLILHKKLGIWVQPGGHVEATDVSLEAAARREVAEEVGLELPGGVTGAIFDIDIHPIPARKDEAAHEHFDVRFCYRAATRAIRASDEVSASSWVELGEIERRTSDESVLRAVRKLVGRTAARST